MRPSFGLVFAARALRARAANDTTRAQINNIPEKSHVIPLMIPVRKSQRKDAMIIHVPAFIAVYLTQSVL